MKRETRRGIEKLFGKTVVSRDLRILMQRSGPAGQEAYGQMILHYDAQMQRVRKRRDDPGVAWGIHDAIDGAVQAHLTRDPNGPLVQCRKGCSHCCYMHIDVTLGEARLLVGHAKDRGVVIDVERLKRQKGKGLQQWKALPAQDKACVFLKDGECSVYEHRPTVCRKHLVITDPALCDTIGNDGARVGRLMTPEAEVAYSALMSHSTIGNMADMLLQAMEEK